MAENTTPETPPIAEQEVALVREVNTLPVETGFATVGGFELLQRVAKMLSVSALVPKEFQGNIANCTIALEMALRMNASPLAVMQSLYIVYGKPSWSSSFIIAAINTTRKFSPLRFKLTGKEGADERTCAAWAIEKATGEALESPPVSIGMAKKEGWYNRNGSKWQTMPELMLRYRAATLFGRLYAPEVLMGMATIEEVIDITPESDPMTAKKLALREKLALAASRMTDAETEEIVLDSAPPNGMNVLRAEREKAIEEARVGAGWTNADVATLVIEIAGKHVLPDALTPEQFQTVLTRIREAK